MSDVKSAVLPFVKAGRISRVWVSSDFANFGSRDAVDKTRRRMVCGGELRSIARWQHDRPTINSLTKRPTSPDYLPPWTPSPVGINFGYWSKT